jgi:hypothetical protein
LGGWLVVNDGVGWVDGGNDGWVNGRRLTELLLSPFFPPPLQTHLLACLKTHVQDLVGRLTWEHSRLQSTVNDCTRLLVCERWGRERVCVCVRV